MHVYANAVTLDEVKKLDGIRTPDDEEGAGGPELALLKVARRLAGEAIKSGKLGDTDAYYDVSIECHAPAGDTESERPETITVSVARNQADTPAPEQA